MKQEDLDSALMAYVEDDDPGPWREVINAIRAGTVVVRNGPTMLTLRVVPRPLYAELARQLQVLRSRSGFTQEEVADRARISMSSVVRLLNGHALGQWPMVSLVVQVMGGDPEDYWDLYQAARTQQRTEGD